MRTLPSKIASALAARPRVFVGDTGVSGRVTVQADWLLAEAVTGIGKWPVAKSPIRWWQAAANDQVEIEIPGIFTISRDKSLENPVPTCEIVVANQKLNPNLYDQESMDLGNPGWLWPLRAHSAEAQARWNQFINDWSNILLPNALIRVYQGFGGHELSIPDAMAAGNLMLRFVGLIDTPQGGTNGKLTLKCRGMSGQLLTEQPLYPPLVPFDQYPLVYQRFVFKSAPLNAAASTVTSGQSINEAPGDRPVSYHDSSSDQWSPTYGGGGPGSDSDLHGHRPTDSLDGNTDSFWLSNGNSQPDKAFAYDWIEYDCGGELINAIYVAPWAGNYTMFISVLEHGEWQGVDVIPYDPSELYATQVTVDTGANIPYVSQQGVPWEAAQEYLLPRAYAADRIRITFHDETYTDWGPWHYRAGVREFSARVSAGGSNAVGSVAAVTIPPIFYAATSIADPDDPTPTGYLTGDGAGQIDAFGDARIFNRTGGDAEGGDGLVSVCFTKSRNGYYALYQDGRVVCHGDAVFYGSPKGLAIDTLPNGRQNIFADILVTHTGLGYWVTRWDGTIHSYGDAPTYSAVSGLGNNVQGRACAHPTAYGLFLIASDGSVAVRGSATNYGSWSGPPSLAYGNAEMAGDIQCTRDGTGYWILTTAGRVEAKGSAANLGGVTSPDPSTDNYQRFWEILPVPDGNGYILMRGDGTMIPIGDVTNAFFGGPAQGYETLRYDGNYKDLTDIVKDILLWSGYWLEEELLPTDEPGVFGTLETTGTYVNDPINSDQLDKKMPMDVINMLKEIVGYIVGERDDGGFFFCSPNWWQSGNVDEDQQHTDEIPEIDERVDLTSLGVQLSGEAIKSPIVIGSSDVDPKNPGSTLHVSYTPPYAGLLHGMLKPLMWTNGAFSDRVQQQVMAELIALHTWFSMRADDVECWIDPRVEVNDQVRILERVTSETYIHYVRAINDTQTLIGDGGGSWTMRLTTNWLGDLDNWAVTADDADLSDDIGMPNKFPLSPTLSEWIQTTGSARVLIGFNTVRPASDMPTEVAPGSQTGSGAATG